ncbi:MAG: hypothetical protein F4051_11455 [Boseongicola sp. SB0670_bin_30]|nr:hypothetical protein [Gammaproteobacteria bacterium]MYK32300.1 hypothetical protein [Boseongicola sp. SB0670_bin_30]
MKTKHWIAAGVGMLAALALYAGGAQATDEPSYRFRLVNTYINKTTYIRCGWDGNWVTVPLNYSIDVHCSGKVAQTKLEGGAAVDRIHDCSPGRPVKRIQYRAYYVGSNLKTSLIIGCRSS